jgi:hypothetical protein
MGGCPPPTVRPFGHNLLTSSTYPTTYRVLSEGAVPCRSKFFKSEDVEETVHSMQDGSVLSKILMWR